MFNIGTGELLVIALLALIVLGPDKLPQAARQIGRFTSQARQIANGFRQEMHSAMKEVGDTASTGDATRPSSAPPATSDPATSDPAAVDPAATVIETNAVDTSGTNGSGASGARLDAAPTGAEPIDATPVEPRPLAGPGAPATEP
jgi:sec-independent protein translocase protein TatB